MASSLDMSVVPASFRAVFVAEPDVGPAVLTDATPEDLGEGDVLIEVDFSSLNYKDGLALTAGAPVVRRFPMIGGIDLTGRVLQSVHERVSIGDVVAVTGCGLGEDHPGGYSTYARVPGDWCVVIPKSLSTETAAAIGTAGITAMLSMMALERNRSDVDHLGELPLLVTGASGGVGSLAVLLGARLGYRVIASTGRVQEREFLVSLGASEVIDRNELADVGRGALAKIRFGAAIDSVGGATLANILRTTRPGGTVTACGLAGGSELDLTVHPFILRGITLVGINSVRPHAGDRETAWQKIAEIIGNEDLVAIGSVIDLEEVIDVAPSILRGEIRGMAVVRVRR